MKKCLFALIAIALSVACAKEKGMDTVEDKTVDNKTENTAQVGESVTISATLPEDLLTKVTFTPTIEGGKPTAMGLTWATGDKIRIYDHSDRTKYNDFTLEASSVGETKGIFSGETTNISAATAFDVEIVNDAVVIGSQTQKEDGNTEHLKYYAPIENIADYSSLTFTNISNILAITAKMPSSEVAAAIKTIEIKASDNDFFDTGVNTLTITLTTKGDAGDDGILHLYANLPQENKAIADGTSLLVHFNAPETAHTVYTRYIELGASNFTAGKLNTININATNSASYANASTISIGESTNPYLIGDKYQLANIDNLMAHSEIKFFKLIDDINMFGASWTPLNNHDSTFDQMIDFDGNYKTVSNLGGTMFYVFRGSIKNLMLDAPTVTNAAQKGAFAQFIQGTGNIINNVDVKDVASFAASSGNCGGFVGRINNGSEGVTTATFTNCDVTNVPVNSSGKAGGFIGSVEAKVVINGCTCTGNTVTNTAAHYAGGLIAYANTDVVISNCYVNMVVNGCNGKNRIGGLIGWAQTGSVTQCHVEGNVSTGGYLGGLIGTVSNSSGQSFSISESCYTTGTVAPNNNYGGGIVGSKEGAGNLSITDCYVSGTIQSDTKQRMGGILAGHIAGTSTLENCYFSGTLSAAACVGGIVGWVESDGLSVIRCMPFPASIHAVQTVETADRYCSGLVIGYGRKDVSAKVVVNHCYRSASIASNFSDYTGVAATNVVEDHDFITEAAQIPQRHALLYGYYHHGQETSSSTLSLLAQRLDIGGAWSGTIWNFDEDYPRLKWMLD